MSAPALCSPTRTGVLTGADADAALDLLGSEHSPLRDGDAVLVKGSHDSGAWRLADFLVERSKEGTQR